MFFPNFIKIKTEHTKKLPAIYKKSAYSALKQIPV